MIAFVLEIVIALVVSAFVVSNFGWIPGIIVFFIIIGISNNALRKD